MALDPILRSLLTAHGPSGFEAAPTAAWLDAARPFSDVRSDLMGSGTARVGGTGNGLTVAVMGHIDEIGLIVTHIDDDGFVYFRAIGSWDPQVLVDVHHETSAPDIDVKQLGAHAFGSGPILDRGSILHPGVFQLLRDTAEAERIPYTVCAVGTPSLTDADSVHCVRAGIATAVIGLPLRYMHSSVEMVDLNDVANAARLIAAFCLRLDPETRLSR